MEFSDDVDDTTLAADTPDGEYNLIQGENSATLSISDDLYDKFIKVMITAKGDFKRHIHHNLDELFLFAEQYRITHDDRYLNAYIIFLKSFLERNKAEFDALDENTLSERNNVQLTWAWGNGFDPCKRLWMVVRSLEHMAYALGEENFDKFPAELFAETAVACMTYGVQPGIKDGRFKVPNQIIYVAFNVTACAFAFREYKYSKNIIDLMLNRWKEGLENTIMPDGTSLEQSIVYNYMPFHVIDDLGIDDEEILKPLRDAVKNLERMLAVTFTPYGMHPNSANHTFLTPPYQTDKEGMTAYLKIAETLGCRHSNKIKWQDFSRFRNTIFHTNEDVVPQFLSVHFPYGGVSVIREKWNYDSRYMYFSAPRAGAGHRGEAVNDVQITAFGRPFLVSGMYFSYNLRQDIPDDFQELMKGMDEYGRSSFSRNTIVVDEKSQTRVNDIESLEKIYDKPTGYRWLDDDSFVYTEGFYGDNYEDVSDVSHWRRIVFDKRNGLFFIVDTMKGKTAHTFSQNWGFMPKDIKYFDYIDGKRYDWVGAGFAKSDVAVDERNNIIYTKDKDAPNMFIYQLCENDISYDICYGEKEPLRGWYNYNNCHNMTYRTKVEIKSKWCSENSSIISIIETSKNDKSKMENVVKDNKTMTFEINDDKYEITYAEEIKIRINNDEITIIDNNVYRKNGDCPAAVGVPKDMRWEDTPLGSKPVYKY